MAFIWQIPGWPALRYDAKALLPSLVELAAARASLQARVSATGLADRSKLALETLQGDALGTSSVEGEELLPESVRSSVARRLGLDAGGLAPVQRNVEGLVEMLDGATRNHRDALTNDRLFGWHTALFPSGFSHLHPITVGSWRTEPVSVQSGRIGAETVHFQAPDPDQVSQEMSAFLGWWNRSEVGDSALKAGLGHLWFETIHPFDDGNGRIGRALVDMALAAGDDAIVRYYSVSAQVFAERAEYYQALEEAQRGGLDATPWLEWFLGCVLRAVRAAESSMESAVLRARLRATLAAMDLGPRQIKALYKLVEHEPAGFGGGLTNAKYRSMTGASKATATRDLADLVQRGFLRVGDASGRSTRYVLSLEP
jgi:Fic family protein